MEDDPSVGVGDSIVGMEAIVGSTEGTVAGEAIVGEQAHRIRVPKRSEAVKRFMRLRRPAPLNGSKIKLTR